MFKINKVEGCSKHIVKELENRTEAYYRMKKYFINKTPFKVIHCEHKRVSLKCKKEFFGSDTKEHQTTTVVVTPKVCWKAYNEKIAPGGHMFKVTPLLFTTHSADSYNSKWMRTEYTSFEHFTMRISEAYLEGEQENIHQPLTHTHCSYKIFSVTLRKNPTVSLFGRM